MSTPSANHDHLAWPFFDEAHQRLARDLWKWSEQEVAPHANAKRAVDESCRALVRQLGEGDWLRYCVPSSHGGALKKIDVRALSLVRETLAHFDGLADFAFAMQGLGIGPIALFGSDQLKARYLPGVRDGTKVAAFALTESEAGSDVTAMRSTAKRSGHAWHLEGEKTFVSNAGIADHYVVFARLPEVGDRNFGAFVVDADNPGFAVTERIDVLAPRPIGTVAFNCSISEDAVIGPHARGLSVALGTLELYRPTVAAAALGFARRAFHEAVAHAKSREAFGKPLADHQITKARIADMALALDASALLTYRAAWMRDQVAERLSKETAMAKLYSTESAQRVIDDAVQILGGRGLIAGSPLERLYREIRALRIYEGTSEIQKLLIAGEVLD
jgi:acyl-CoA dehydrogenase